jgi:hypothetical protein
VQQVFLRNFTAVFLWDFGGPLHSREDEFNHGLTRICVGGMPLLRGSRRADARTIKAPYTENIQRGVYSLSKKTFIH